MGATLCDDVGADVAVTEPETVIPEPVAEAVVVGPLLEPEPVLPLGLEEEVPLTILMLCHEPERSLYSYEVAGL